MPEGPELHLASRFINHVCKGRVFGRIAKSDISKNPEVIPPSTQFAIGATSRGKEIKLTLQQVVTAKDKKKTKNVADLTSLDVTFTFGLAGKFEFCKEEELHKHAHLKFFTDDNKPQMVLSFVDYMRFGKWKPHTDFSYKDRGPCVLTDYVNFRSHVLQNIDNAVFDKAICEVLMNQKYFNGIGNYLRAEILHRLNIPPFVTARSVLQPLVENSTVKLEHPDILQLCNTLPNEVVSLESSWYDGGDRSDDTNAFNNWLQCYYQEGMKNMVDRNKRTVWYSGPAGPLAPKEGQTRGKKRSKSKKKQNDSESDHTDQVDTKDTDKKSSYDVEAIMRPSKPKKSKHTKQDKSKQDEETVPDSEDLQNGRLTRRKVKQIVEAIDNLQNGDTYQSRSKVKAKKVKSGKATEKTLTPKKEENEVTSKTQKAKSKKKC